MPRQEVSKCSCDDCSHRTGTCVRAQQNAAKYVTYCGRCYTCYVCKRCGVNAVAGNIRDGVCKQCESQRYWWCECPGCSEGGLRHVHHGVLGVCCPRLVTKKKGQHKFCAHCLAHWKCEVCGKIATECAERPQSTRCGACAKHTTAGDGSLGRARNNSRLTMTHRARTHNQDLPDGRQQAMALSPARLRVRVALAAARLRHL